MNSRSEWWVRLLDFTGDAFLVVATLLVLGGMGAVVGIGVLKLLGVL